VLARQIQRIYERSMLGHLFPGDPAHGLTYLHMDDLLDALVRIVDRRAALPAETVLLLGEPEPVSYGTLQDEIGRLLHGEEWATQRVPAPLAKAGAWVQEHLPGGDPFVKPWMISHADDHYALDIARARRVLEWKPRRKLLEVLPTLLQNLRSDPERWYEENDLKARDAEAA
jgi:nucleoside-diphosphate-sugar epimerase